MFGEAYIEDRFYKKRRAILVGGLRERKRRSVDDYARVIGTSFLCSYMYLVFNRFYCVY